MLLNCYVICHVTYFFWMPFDWLTFSALQLLYSSSLFFRGLIIILCPCISTPSVSLPQVLQCQQPRFILPLPSFRPFVLPHLSLILLNSYLFSISHLYVFRPPSINIFNRCFLSPPCSLFPLFLCLHYFRLLSEVKWFTDVRCQIWEQSRWAGRWLNPIWNLMRQKQPGVLNLHVVIR